MRPNQQGRSTKPISKPVTIAELSLSDTTDMMYGPVKFPKHENCYSTDPEELCNVLHVLKERLEPQATLKPKAMESLQDPVVPVRSKVFAVRAISQ